MSETPHRIDLDNGLQKEAVLIDNEGKCPTCTHLVNWGKSSTVKKVVLQMAGDDVQDDSKKTACVEADPSEQGDAKNPASVYNPFTIRCPTCQEVVSIPKIHQCRVDATSDKERCSICRKWHRQTENSPIYCISLKDATFLNMYYGNAHRLLTYTTKRQEELRTCPYSNQQSHQEEKCESCITYKATMAELNELKKAPKGKSPLEKTPSELKLAEMAKNIKNEYIRAAFEDVFNLQQELKKEMWENKDHDVHEEKITPEEVDRQKEECERILHKIEEAFVNLTLATSGITDHMRRSD
ncbi:hypothetical protein QR680_004152 [Steinernema hermaphroditum]|uniref:Uncharacterized protein n=1 Tax=Steinernema hermaphroditum TaxID=289476 RepID=A0AA39HP85_9BILA|nr:hypothetical protein QR680_004152 [Steinernema hermaphroditum]